MESNGKVAQLRLEPETCNLKEITLYIRNLRFKCQRCATFCCKLGGPQLSLKDIERLEKAGCKTVQLIEGKHDCLESKADGSCVFLRFNEKKDVYECSVHVSRPALCRLYPFYFEKTCANSFILKLLPCKGISRRIGEPVDEKFIISHLLHAALGL